jgi:predicted PurR-regulated permease PerM
MNSAAEIRGASDLSPELTGEKRVGAVLFYGIVLLLLYFIYLIFAPFIAPLAWAAVLVVFFFPLHKGLEKRTGPNGAAAISTIGVILILVIPLLLVGAAFVREAIELAARIQQNWNAGRFDWANRAWEWIQLRIPGESPEDLNVLVRQGAEKTAAFLAGELGVVLRNVARLLFALAVMILAMFYFFRDGDDIMDRLRRTLPFEEEHRDRVLTEARELIFASVLSSLATAVLHGFVGGMMFLIVGISAALFWGVMMAFFSMLPVVGSSVIWLPAAIWLIATGHTARGIVLAAVCAGVIAVVENILRPAMIGGRVQLSGLLVFISVLGGIAAFGVLGIVLGPIIVATTASVLALYSHPELSRHARAKPLRP